MKDNVIKKIELEVEGQTLKVSPEGAIKLFEALGELLNLPIKQEKQLVPYPVPMPQPYPYPVYPPRIIWTTGGTQITNDRFTINYSSDNHSAKMLIN